MHKVTIWTDGSSLRNPGHAGCAALLRCNGVEKELTSYIGIASNNVAEVSAAILGLRALKSPCEVTVISDSEYLVEIASKRRMAHSNQEIWNELFTVMATHKVTFQWVRGHSGVPENERVNALAFSAAIQGHDGNH